jgi:hypothetical protein
MTALLKKIVLKNLWIGTLLLQFFLHLKKDVQSPGEASRKGIYHLSPFLGMICLGPDFDSGPD